MNSIRCALFSFSTLFITSICAGQDSIKVESKLSITTRGQHNIAALNSNFDCFNCPTGRVEDNPFHHLGIYTGIDHNLIVNDQYSIETGLYLEERSHSGGNNTLSNLVVFPKILIEAKGKLTNGGLRYKIRGGDFWDEDVSDMMRLYNIDYQGIFAQLEYDEYSLGFMTVGDLSRNIGLDLHQLYKFYLNYTDEGFHNSTSFTVNEIFTGSRGGHPTPSDINVRITPSSN